MGANNVNTVETMIARMLNAEITKEPDRQITPLNFLLRRISIFTKEKF